MLSITRKISKYNHYKGNDPKYIVIHDTGNYKDTALNNANYFSQERKSSAHYFVDENSIYQVVEDFNGSWAVGDGKGKYGITNKNSISVEMCNSGGYIEGITIRNTLELVRHLMKKYDIPIDKVVRHYDASRKMCPNNMSKNNWNIWYDFKEILKEDTNRGDDMIADTVKVSACKQSPIAKQIIEEIKILEKVVGLKEDGIATEELVKKLPELNGTEQRGVVTVMQRILILKGFLSAGSATGIIGPACKSAINKFKESIGIPLNTTLIDRQTWRKLLEY